MARGRYDHAHEIVVRGDVLQGVPGVRIVTPLLLATGGPAVLVDRGFLPAPDAVTVDLRGAEEPGELEVRGIALPVPTGPGEPIEHGGRHHLAAAGPGALRARLPYAVLPVTDQAEPGQRAAPLPPAAGAAADGRRAASGLRGPVVSVRADWRWRSRCWWSAAAGRRP